jgi:hypothetical protein
MAVSIITYTADGSTNQFSITFDYISQSHVVVTVDGTSAAFTFINTSTVQLNSTPSSGSKVQIQRVTPVTAIVDFTDGSTLFEADLDLADKQSRFISEEAKDIATDAKTTIDNNIADVNTVAGNSADISTVAGVSSSVSTVAGIAANVTTAAGNTTNINTVAANDANITAVGGISNNVTTVAGISGDVTAVADITTNVTTVAGISANVTAVAADATDIGAVAGKATEIGRLGTSDAVADLAILGTSDAVSDMNTLAAISSDITAAANVSADITSTANNSANINTVAGSISNVNTVAGISSDVTSVAAKASLITSDFISDLNTVAVTDVINDINTLATSDIVSDLNTLATSDIVSDLNTLATSDIVSDINTLATSDIVTDLNLLATSDFVADLNTMATSSNVSNLAITAGISSNITTAAGISSNITTVAGVSSDVSTVAGISGNVTTVANNDSNITSVAGNASNINTVAGVSSNVTTVAGIASNVTAVAGDATDIGTVASDLSGSNNIGSVAGAISNVNSVAGSISNVNTVASNISSVNDFADKYRIGSSDPTSNNDEGDLFYNTTLDTLKVYTGGAWEQGVTAGSGFLPLTGGQLSGNLTFAGSQTVDGRDVSADGTKLDGIEAGATGDQTNAEIRAAVEAASDSNVFTDADHTKLDGIAAGADVTPSWVPASNPSYITDGDVSNNAAVAANTAKVSNATHTGEVTGSTSLTVANNVIDAGNLKVSGNGNNTQFLRSDGDGTFTWATPASGGPDVTVSTVSNQSGIVVTQGSATSCVVVHVSGLIPAITSGSRYAYVQFSTNNGSSYYTGSNDYTQGYTLNGGNVIYQQASTKAFTPLRSTHFRMFNSNFSSDPGINATFVWNLSHQHRFGGNYGERALSYQGIGTSGTTSIVAAQGFVSLRNYNHGRTANAFRIIPTSGNWQYGKVTIIRYS